MKQLFRTKISSLHSTNLKRCLTATDLVMLGIGAIIGAGIFVLTGIAAASQAGPAIIFSYILAGTACTFTALSYAELASSFEGCGGAYGYAYAGIGEVFAWMIGWDLLLEYGMDAATISIGWSGYFQNTLHAMGLTLPKCLTIDPFHGGIINLPASMIICSLAWILSIGVKESAKFNQWIVYIKLLVIALFIGIGMFHFNPANWHPFMPFGAQGIINGASFIFFAYIGFDVVSTAGEETINPKRNLPIGIILSLVICTLIYIAVAIILTGICHYTALNVSSPVAITLFNLGYHFAGEIIAIGALAGLTTAILGMYYGFTRVFLAMSRDGLLPYQLTKIHEKTQTPRRLIWTVGFLMALIAGFIPIKEIANLVNIGTLAAFIAVCGSVIILRSTQPNLTRSFKTWSPIIPLLGIILCFYLMIHLSKLTWVSFTIWTAFGFIIYFSYSRINSSMATQQI